MNSENKTEYNTGAIRDSKEGKGRCDLLPLDICYELTLVCVCDAPFLQSLELFKKTGHFQHLFNAYVTFCEIAEISIPASFLEVSKRLQFGVERYGENNWQKGIPLQSYIDSCARHYIKWLATINDDEHEMAVLWNLMCGAWTCKNIPELNTYEVK